MTTLLTGGNEFRVNATTGNDQMTPSVAKVAGGYVVVWESVGSPSAHDAQGQPLGADIFMQRYSDSGVAVGAETQVNSVAFNDQIQPTVTALADGGYVVAWSSNQEYGITSYDYGVYTQRFDSLDTAVGAQQQANFYTYLNQDRPSMAALTGGGYVVAFSSDVQFLATVTPPSVLATRFGADGLPAGDAGLGSGTPGADAVTVGLADGGYVIAWTTAGDIHAQRFDAAGAAQGPQFQVNTTTANAQSHPAITALNDGGFLMAWTSDLQDGSGLGIELQRYDAAGHVVDAETQVNSSTAGDQRAPVATALSDGSYVVAWVSAGQDGSGDGVYFQHYGADGKAAGVETLVNATTAGDQSAPSLTATGDGGFIASWMSAGQDGSGWGVYAREFDPVAASSAPPADLAKMTISNSGLHTAVINAPMAGIQAYSLVNGVLSVTTAGGTQTLAGVDRVSLNDALFALDTHAPANGAAGGHAWQAAALFNAAFGVLPGQDALSQWTAQADHSTSMADLAQHMIAQYAPAGISSADLVMRLYLDLTSTSPSADVVQSLVDRIGPGHEFATQADLFAYAASLQLNTDHMAGFVGSIQALAPGWFVGSSALRSASALLMGRTLLRNPRFLTPSAATPLGQSMFRHFAIDHAA